MSWIKRNIGLIIITVVYLLTFLYMLPLRNQTYQDDWAYIQSVRTSLETGTPKISEWSSASLVSQVYWGILFSKIFGFSIKILHLSTIVLLYFGLVAFYLLLRNLNIDNIRSVFYTLFLLAFPWTLHFAYTFLTDIPYMSLLIISLYLYIRGIKKESGFSLILGSVFSGFAFLTRQLGLVIPLAIAVTLIHKGLSKKKISYLKLLQSITPFLLMAFSYFTWLNYKDNQTTAQFLVNVALKTKLSYLLPIRLEHIRITNETYSVFVERILFYLHISIGFILPIFIVFKIKPRQIINFIKRSWKTILGVSIAYLLFLGHDIFFHFGRGKYLLESSSLITKFDRITPIDWNIKWKFLVTFSVPIWTLIISYTIDNIARKILRGRRKILKETFPYSIVLFIVILVIFQAKVFWIQFKHLLPNISDLSFFQKINVYVNIFGTAILSKDGLDILTQSWYVLFLPTLIFLTLILIISYNKLRKRIQFDLALEFVSLTFVFQMGILIVLMYYHWAQYVISIIPFLIIWIATITRKIEFNKFLATIVLLSIMIFSVSLIKDRYERNGARWEFKEKLIKEYRVDPININGEEDESWLRWWYFEETFKQAIDNEFSGDKYKISLGQLGTWTNAKSVSNIFYDTMDIPVDYDITKHPEYGNIVLDSGPHYSSIFSRTRHIIVNAVKEIDHE